MHCLFATRTWLMLLVAILAARGIPSAQTQRPLPPVEVVASGGVRSTLPELAVEGQWLIVSVAPSSPASSRLLEALTQWELGAATSRLLVVAAGVAEATPLMETWAGQLSGSRWVADPTNEIARSLNLRGAPMVVGVRGGEIVWTLAGVLNDPGMLRDVATSWLAASP